MTSEEKTLRNSEIILRVRQLITDHNLSDGKFADAIDMDRSGFSKRMSGKVSVGKAFIEKIVSNFNVERQWLLTGIGDVYKKEREISIITDSNFTRIPVVQSQTQGEYLKFYKNEEFIKTLYSVPEKVDTSFKGKYRIFQVEGDAMVDGSQNSILSNDLVLGREVSLDSVESKCESMIRRIFMVTYKDGIIPRKFCSYNKETREIRFEPLNFLYSDIQIKLDDILELYNIVKILSREI